MFLKIFDAYISGLPLLVVGLWSFLTYYLPDPYLQPPSASAIPYSMDDSYYKKDDGTTGRWNSSTENIELVSNSYTAEQGKQNSLGRNVMLFIKKGSLESPLAKIQTMGRKICLRCKSITKKLLTTPSKVLPLYLKQTFLAII